MAQRSAVPKFGNWEGEGDVPYTVFFDNARKDKRARHKTNPNDPEENPSLHSRDRTPDRAPTFRNSVQSRTVGEVVARPNHAHQSNKEDSDLNQSNGSPWRRDTVDRKTSTASPNNLRYGDNGLSFGDSAKRNGRVGADRSYEQSPLHQQNLTKTGGRGNGMSSLTQERKLFEGSNIAGRSRMRPVADETALPKFGDWDVKNPASADGFTQAFDQVRNEKKGGSAKVPIMNGSPNNNNEKQVKNEDSMVCSCFSWCRK
ncbi:hypothetical protein Scep_010588 [Stephania cephalantha]|uniref:RIN4 pathogenic type III effector avirulence factor Avr cleavage site domain-containing protein n=1 Tax=Stephania cephalantha TaxID=152367 RepID=A0AAP0JVF0_9MAGN